MTDMRSIGVLLVLLCLTTVPAAAPSAEEGIKVYAAQKCRVCPAIGGVGNPKGPLDGIATKLTEAEIREWILHPIEMAAKTKSIRTPAMKPMSLSAAQVDSLVAYLLTLKAKP